MNFTIHTYKQAIKFTLICKTKTTQSIRCRLYDYEERHNIKKLYGDKKKHINGKGVFEFHLPFTPEELVVEVYNERYGNMDGKIDRTFEILDYFITNKK